MGYVILTLVVLAAFVAAVAALYRAGLSGPRRYHAPVGGPPDRDVDRELAELRAFGGTSDLARQLH
jgi:hypothetical protein